MKSILNRIVWTLLLGLLALGVEAQVIYVDSAATGVGNGSSWVNAYPRLELALVVAVPGDSVWVAAGTYFPTTTGSRTVSFVLPAGVVIMGGFTGGESSACEADPEVNVTVLSGDIGVVGDSTDNSYHVIYSWNLQQTTTVDGFVVRDGEANGNGGQAYGGGMYVDQIYLPAELFIRNCKFTSNHALRDGSGAWVNGASATFTDCMFDHNYGGLINLGNGAALRFNLGSLTLIGCNFSYNLAEYGQGAGLCASNGNLRMQDCEMAYNRATGPPLGCGGGMLLNGISAIIDHCLFKYNEAEIGGGGYFAYSAFRMRNCTFIGNSMNTASTLMYGGGGLFVQNSGGLRALHTIKNCKFLGNHSSKYGGGFFSYDSQAELQDVVFSGNSSVLSGGGAGFYNGVSDTNYVSNCTFVQNTSGSASGGGLYDWCGWAPIKVKNCILTGNVPSQFYDQPSAAYPSELQHSLLDGGCVGLNNLNANPLLRDADGVD